MSDIHDLIEAIDRLSEAVTKVINVNDTPVNTQTKVVLKKPKIPAPVEGPPETTTPSEIPPMDRLNRICLNKANSVPNAKLLIQNRLFEGYQVTGLSELPATLYVEFAEYVQAITAEDVTVFLASRQTASEQVGQ